MEAMLAGALAAEEASAAERPAPPRREGSMGMGSLVATAQAASAQELARATISLESQGSGTTVSRFDRASLQRRSNMGAIPKQWDTASIHPAPPSSQLQHVPEAKIKALPHLASRIAPMTETTT